MYQPIQKVLATQARTITEDHMEYLTLLKTEYMDNIRSIYGVMGSTMMSYDWQSPSFLHTLRSLSGLQTGNITANINDYKRDQHLDAGIFEKQFIKEYISSPIKPFVKAYATNSGMAAFTTALGFVLSKTKHTDTIFFGKHSYFEYQAVLRKIFHDQYIEFDESDFPGFLTLIKKHKPSALFFDTLTNSENVLTTDTKELIHTAQTYNPRTTIVIDNTCMGVRHSPIKHIKTPLSNSHIIVFESLNKFYQFGMDRVTGGIVYGIGRNIGMLYTFRDHLGTIISDASVASIPTPNREILSKRVERIHSNTIYLASRLNEFITTHNTIIQSVNYPKSVEQKKHEENQILRQFSPFITLSMKKKFKKVSLYRRFIAKTLQKAKKQNIQLISGTSFGLDTTRIYLTANNNSDIEPFVRISPGIETYMQMKQIIQVLTSIL